MIVFISCGKKKQKKACMAKDMYIGMYFNCIYSYAKHLKPRKIYILSAKYGVLNEQDYIYPYEKTLKNSSAKECKNWAYMVIKQLKQKGIDTNTKEKIVFLCGKKYREYLAHLFVNVDIPFAGIGMGKQMQIINNILRR